MRLISSRRWSFSHALVLLALGACASAPTPVAARQEGETVAYIVRHAEKATSARPQPDPDLSSDGRLRAQKLAERLERAGITRIIVTNLKRTQQTATPLATRLNIVPETVLVSFPNNVDLVPNHADSVAAAIRRHAGEAILVVGHSNTVPAIIAALGGPRFPNICDSQYSDLFIVTIPASGTPRVNQLHYGPADPIDPSCADMPG